MSRSTATSGSTSTRQIAMCCRSLASSGYRLRPDASGYDNLFLAGDWTECTLNAGCVEAAVISGMAAARAIGTTEIIEIIGERARR